MFKVKVFRDEAGSAGEKLESQVNTWLAKNPNARIEKMTQSESRSHYTSYYTLTFLYREEA